MPLLRPAIQVLATLTLLIFTPFPAGQDTHAEPTPFVWTKENSQAWVQAEAQEAGWIGKEWICLNTLIFNESRWNYQANNKHSTAYGLFQILDTPEDLTVEEQTIRGLRYIATRYGSPCKALAYWNRMDRHGSPWY